MDFSGSKRKPPRADLREQVLKRETKRQQSQVLSEMGAASNLSQEALHLLEAKEEQPAMPTDFSAFNASLKPASSLPARQEAAAGRQALATFQDLTSARAAGASEEQRSAAARAYLEVTRSFSLKAEDRLAAAAADGAQAAAAGGQQQENCGGGGAAEAAAAAAAPGSARSAHQLQDLQCPPVDWSLKSSVRVVSSSPFPGLTPAVLGATRPGSRACECLAHPASATSCAYELPTALPAALHSWQHPASAIGTDALSELLASPAGRQMMQQRLSSWRAALRSLYYQLRHGSCHAFYVVAQQGHKSPYTVLLTAAGMRGCSSLQAAISQSSTTLRNRLARMQLRFSMPGYELQHQDQEQQLGDHCCSLPAKYDSTPRSQLLLEGEAAVHGLFDLLYNEAGFNAFGEAAADLPLLLAPVPFEGACLQWPQVRLMQGALLLGPGGEGGEGGSGSSGHKLEVSGLVPCWAVVRLMLALQAAGCQAFTAHLVTAPASEALNRVHAAGISSNWAQLGAGLGGARSVAELQLWQAPVAVLGAGVVSEVHCGFGGFSCRLTGAQLG